MLHHELVAAVEQVGQRAPAGRRVEEVVLVHANPRQRAALARDLVAEAGQLLLARQQLLAFGKPLLPGHDGMVRKGMVRGGTADIGNGGGHGVLLDVVSGVVGHVMHLGPDAQTVGVTSVAGFPWTR